jgi:hypothetical protein
MKAILQRVPSFSVLKAASKGTGIVENYSLCSNCAIHSTSPKIGATISSISYHMFSRHRRRRRQYVAAFPRSVNWVNTVLSYRRGLLVNLKDNANPLANMQASLVYCQLAQLHEINGRVRSLLAKNSSTRGPGIEGGLIPGPTNF